jgi:hypothetical protein
MTPYLYLASLYSSFSDVISRTVSAFQLWFDSNRSELEEEHPDVSEEELAKFAVQAFRQVPKEERKVISFFWG